MITLEQFRVGRQDKVDQQVVDTFRRNSLLLDKLVFDDCLVSNGGGSTLKYGYMRTKVPSVADFREIGKEYTPQESTREECSVNVKIFGGSYAVDRVIEGASGQASEIARQTEDKIRATCNLFHKTVIQGDSDADEKAFDGLDKALKGTKTEINAGSFLDVSTAAALDENYKTLLDLLDEFLSQLNGTPACIMANKSMITKLKGAARRAGYLTRAEDAFGRSIDCYDGVPFLDMANYAEEENGEYQEKPIIPIDTRTIGEKEVTGLTDIYAPVISLTGFHGVTVKGDKFVSQYLPDFKTPGAVKKGEVEMLAAVALKNSRAAAVLRNIKIK